MSEGCLLSIQNEYIPHPSVMGITSGLCTALLGEKDTPTASCKLTTPLFSNGEVEIGFPLITHKKKAQKIERISYGQ